MAPDEAVTLTCHPQDSGGNNRLSHTPVPRVSAAPVGEAPAPLTSSSRHQDCFPSAVLLSSRSSERQRKVENFENFPPRRPLRLAPIELPLEVKEAQRQKINSIWKQPVDLEVKNLSSPGKALLLPVNQITTGQSLVKKELAHQVLKTELAIHSSPDHFQAHQNTTSGQSGSSKVDLPVHKAGGSKLRRTRQLEEDQAKSHSSADGLKDNEGKPAASGATLCQRGVENVPEKSWSRNQVGRVSEVALVRGSKRMVVYGIQEAAL